MNPNKLQQQFQDYVNDRLPDDEAAALLKSLQSGQDEGEYIASIQQTLETDFSLEITGNPEQMARLETSWLIIKSKVTPKPARLRRLWWPAAAAIILLASAIAVFFLTQRTKPTVSNLSYRNDALPGTTKAILKDTRGHQIALDGHAGRITIDPRAHVTDAGGKLQYKTGTPDEKLSINTLTTPRGGHYQLQLSDGTEIYLDASSAVRYPTAFNGKERRIEVSGQVYLKVAHNAHKPFLVSAGSSIIEDIGTEFNINAYDEGRGVVTTLVKGVVRVGGWDITKPVLLKPGQAASVTMGKPAAEVTTADVESVIAWKDGYFNFDKQDINTIMNTICRWYDVDPVYIGKVPTGVFTGSISRIHKLSDVLFMMEVSGRVYFEIKGKQVFIHAGKRVK